MIESKTHWKKLHNPDYLGAWSIPEDKDLILTIDFVNVEEVTGAGGRKEQLSVCHFKEKVKPLVLNVTNSRQIQSLHGTPFIEDWNGKQIALYSDTTMLAKEEVECVRIRAKIPNISKPSFSPEIDRWDGAVVSIADGKSTIEAIKKHYSLSEEHEAQIKKEIQEYTEGLEEAVNE